MFEDIQAPSYMRMSKRESMPSISRGGDNVRRRAWGECACVSMCEGELGESAPGIANASRRARGVLKMCTGSRVPLNV